MSQTSPLRMNLVLEIRLLRKQFRICCPKKVFPFPGSFILGMVFPLHLVKLNRLAAADSFHLIQYSEKFLFICKILSKLYFCHISKFLRWWDTPSQLWYVEDIMYLWQFRGKFHLICHCPNLGHNWEWANISWCKLYLSLKSLDSFHRCDSEVHMLFGFKADLKVLCIIITLLSGLSQL